MTILKNVFWIITLSFLSQVTCKGQVIFDTLKTVKMTALASEQPLSLRIQWWDDIDVNTYSLYKKLPQDTDWGTPLIVTGDQDTSFVDTNIEEGNLYEYRIVKVTGDTVGYGYLLSGVNYLPPQKKGDILIVIDSTAATFVEDNISTYMDVLTSEGWIPWLLPVAEESSVQEIKSLILENYTTRDSLSAVLLMGNIAVPHSGNITPDGHSNHKGAWPADAFYGDIDGVWTDETVNNNTSIYPSVHNVPGDGKFDQDSIPSNVELAVGRMDFSELPVFDLNEYELLDNYLEKNIAFRTGDYQVRKRAIFRNISPWAEGLGQNAIRSFVPIVSNDSIVYDEIMAGFEEPYLWSYFGSAGYMFGAFGLGDINTFADNNYQVIFTGFFGSTYGDFDNENNFLRTVLASGKVLSTAWVGAPSWHFHPMGLGMDLGFCTLLTQNNLDLYYPGVQAKFVTINLLGDPTLKTFIVRPPSNLNAVQNENHVELSWSSSPEDIQGYQVYKKTEGMNYFEPLHLSPITETNFVDSCIAGGTQIKYLVKAVKQEITPSGSFINHSSGPIVSIQTTPNVLPEAGFSLSWMQGILTGINTSTSANQYHWVLPNGTIFSDEILETPYNQSGETNITLIASNDCFSDTLQQNIFITELTELKPEESEVYIYPNPTQNQLTLEAKKTITKVEIYDALGAIVFTDNNINSNQHQINLQKLLSPGGYLLKVYLGNQAVIRMVKLIPNE